MAKGWKCARCSAENGDRAVICSQCGLIRGSVVIPASPDLPAMPSMPAPDATVDPPSTIDRAVNVGPPSFPGPPESPPTALPAPASKPLWRRIPIGWIVIAMLFGGGAVAGAIFNASRSSSGAITKAGDLPATDLRVGDCFDIKDSEADTVNDVTARPCAEPHQYEMFFVGIMPSGGYPGDDGFTAFLDSGCKPAFYEYVGRIYGSSELDIYALYPSTDGWNHGDRSVQCAVFQPGFDRLTTSLKGSHQ